MDCSQYPGMTGCTPHHGLPYTGGVFELVLLVGFAVVAIALGLLLRRSA